MYDVVFHTYSGMDIPLGENMSRDEAEGVIRRRLRAARRFGQPVTKIGKGRWECQTPDDAWMVSDNDGVLAVRKHRVHARR